MKRKLILGVFLLAILGVFARGANAAVSVSISVFEDELSPYGSWADVPTYGTCWRPSRVAASWQPYTVGEWAYTDYDWTWVSADPWGGIPYHYGTWVWVSDWGWCWIPGTVWAPAWVTWCYGDDYVGWAPIPPSMDITDYGYAGPAVVVSASHYCFVPANRFVGVNIASVRVAPDRNAAIFSQTRQRTTRFSVSRGIIVNPGPPVQRIEQATHTRIARRSVSFGKADPTPFSSTGAGKGSRFGIVASNSVRSKEVRNVSKGGPPHEEHATAERYTPPPKEHHEKTTTHHDFQQTPPPSHEGQTMNKERHVEHTPPPPPPSHETHTMNKERHVEHTPPPPPPSHETHTMKKESHVEHTPPPPPPPSVERHEQSFHHQSPPPPPPPSHATGQGSSHSRGGPPPGKGKPAPKKQEQPPPPPPH